MRYGGNAPEKEGPGGWPCLYQTQAKRQVQNALGRLCGTCIVKSAGGPSQPSGDGEAMGTFQLEVTGISRVRTGLHVGSHVFAVGFPSWPGAE